LALYSNNSPVVACLWRWPREPCPISTDADFEALEHSIETCAPTPASKVWAVHQRREDLHFHDILAEANPNGVLRCMCEVINHLLRHLLVAKGDRLLLEHYETGEDENWGTKLGRVAFGPVVRHDLRSVSKSVVGLLYGIALAEGKVPPPEAKLYARFPEYADLAAQSGRDRLTIAHVLSMTLGFEWDELTIPYDDPRNSENAMVVAPDRYRYILERPIVGEPGSKWVYCGGATALLGR
jgi:hypothetical protein